MSVTQQHEVNPVDFSLMDEEQALAYALSDDDAPAQGEAPEQPEQQQETSLEEPNDLAASLEAALGETPAEQQQPEEPNAAPVDAEKLKELDGLFQSTLGFPISDAVEKMTSFSQVAEATLTQIEQARSQLALQMQEFELKQHWANDPSAQGLDINAVVRERLGQLTGVYSKLNPELQQKLAMAGTQGIITLWNLVKGGSASTAKVVPTGRADIAPSSGPTQGTTLSEVMSLDSDDAFWKQMEMAQKSRRPFTNDTGLDISRRR